MAVFKEYADAAIEEILSRGHIPIIAGGTGFYIQAVLNDITFTEMDADKAFRERLESIAKEKGSEYLHDMLRAVDEKAAEEIHHNNVKRVVRALEFYHETGKKISEHNEEESKKSSPYNFAYFVLTMDRAKLYERIEKRIDLMMEAGLLDEVKALKAMGLHADMVSMKGLGYKEILGYLSGEFSLEEAIYILKRDTRRFAKRQLTWFRREKEVIWLEKEAYAFDEEKILEEMLKILKERGIINE